jgi:hypothetical protein
MKGDAIYNHEGNVVAAMAECFKKPVTPPPPKGFKQFEPFKSFEEFKPFEPFFSLNWLKISAAVLFLGGTN